jgi:hypothetical protein
VPLLSQTDHMLMPLAARTFTSAAFLSPGAVVQQDDEEYRAVLESFTASVSLASRRILRKPGLAGIAEYIASGKEHAGHCLPGQLFNSSFIFYDY